MNKTHQAKATERWTALSGLVLSLVVVLATMTSRAQTFNSGSDGSDGALTIPANAGTIVFDPTDIARWGRILDPDGDGVYNFTTITINSGSTLRLRGDKVSKPVHWLATGDVVINGVLDLSGATGVGTTDLSVRRQVAIPGSGGFAGGAGGTYSNPSAVPATPGEGPGGGTGGNPCGTGSTTTKCGNGGTFTGNRYLVPLIGGSGGSGAVADGAYNGGGGGGGAILIASSTSIAVNGSISAAGGGGVYLVGFYGWLGAGGSGGAIRLVAPTLSGSGHLNVNGGFVYASNGGCYAGYPGYGCSNSLSQYPSFGSQGWVRLEGFTISNSLVLDTGNAFVMRSSPIDPSTLRPASSIRITAVNGIQVPLNPSGSFALPDVTISSNGSVNIDIAATGIPSGTVVTLQVYPQSPLDMTTVNLPTAQATLVGTLQSSSATAIFTFPYGFSKGFVRATWTQ